MSSSLPLRPPFAEALATLRYCLLHPAESSDAAMHSDAWVRSVFVSWRRLHTAWVYGEEGFLEDRKWMALENQIWGLLAQVNQDLVNDCCDEYNDLVAEAVSPFFPFRTFPADPELFQLKCGVNIEPIEMESESESEEAPSPFPEPSPQALIPPMPHTPTPEPQSSTPVPPPPKKYKFGPKTINGTRTF